MDIIKDIEIVDLALKIKNVLILGDIHIGYEEALNKSGFLIPRISFEQLIDRIEKILKNNKIETIIINGDLKHEFGRISDQEWKDTLFFLRLLNKYVKKIILIKGNHDNIVDPILEKIDGVMIVDYKKIDDVFICHGDKLFENIEYNSSKTIIISHEHPAITINEGNRAETFKCFLKGKYDKKDLLVLPSFMQVTCGTNILTEKLLSPFLQQDLSKFDVFIVEDKEVFKFGKVKELIR